MIKPSFLLLFLASLLWFFLLTTGGSSEQHDNAVVEDRGERSRSENRRAKASGDSKKKKLKDKNCWPPPKERAYPTAVDEFEEIHNRGYHLVEDMINFAFDGYIRHAFPQDELDPLLCRGTDNYGSLSLTLIDSLDLLAIIGRHDDFRKYVLWYVTNVDFDIDINVSVFETNIRVLGGLLSAHFMYEEGIVEVKPEIHDYAGELLVKAVELADRLLPAFDTPTKIPYGTVNLRHGVPKNEIDVTSTANGGTFLLEMTVLSVITGNPTYEAAARQASRALFRHRSRIGLVGNHINITSGRWTLEYSSAGSGIDSFIEYLLKAYVLTGDLEYFSMFEEIHESLLKYARKGPWYVDVHIDSGLIVNQLHNSLASFYPGNLILRGHIAEAKESLYATHQVFKRFGAIPEGFNLLQNMAQHGQTRYPLRPEHAESLYMMYETTKDPAYILMGYEMLVAINTRTRTHCGFASLEDVSTLSRKFGSTMESFLLSETLKYLYLLFNAYEDHSESYDGPIRPRTPIRMYAGKSAEREGLATWVFNTEGHPFPVTSEWNLDEWYDSRFTKMTRGIPQKSTVTHSNFFLSEKLNGFESIQCKRRTILDDWSFGGTFTHPSFSQEYY